MLCHETTRGWVDKPPLPPTHMHGPSMVYVREPTLPTHEIGGPTQFPMHLGGLSEVGPGGGPRPALPRPGARGISKR